MLRATMNALRFSQKGPIDTVLKLEQVQKPSLAAGEALVRVKAAGINGVRSARLSPSDSALTRV